jgi:membrane-bound lytic murein transglycosylase A
MRLFLVALSAVCTTHLTTTNPVEATTGRPLLMAAGTAPSVQLDTRLWNGRGDRAALLRSLDSSLRYLRTARAAAAYKRSQARSGITQAHVQRSLVRFRQLLLAARTPQQLQAALQREFAWRQSVGHDGRGNVAFTGYYNPVVSASRVRTSVYRYPLYGLPRGFRRWSRPHPTRAQLEGVDGLHPSRLLRGAELVWLRDRLDAYLVQVQGSARLRLTNGRTMTVGYAGHTAHPYVSMGRQLVHDGKMAFEELTLPLMVDYFRRAPYELNSYLPRNNRFIFFRETRGAPVSGAIGVPLTAERSIATDKALMPPGALALVQIEITNPAAVPVLGSSVTRLVLDQDAGSAIKGAGRVDVYMGSGEQAGQRAGVINSPGRLYYLLLKRR